MSTNNKMFFCLNRRISIIATSLVGLSLLVLVSFPITSIAGSMNDVEVLLSGPDLKADLDISNKVIRPIGQLKKAGFTIQNLSENTYHLEYQVVWFDRFTQTVSTGVWYRFTLPPNMGKGITSLGKSPDSEKAVFQVRLPNDFTIDEEPLQEESLKEEPLKEEPLKEEYPE